MVVDEIGVVLWRIFVSTLFATLLMNQKNNRGTIVPVGSSASLLWSNVISCYQKLQVLKGDRFSTNKQQVPSIPMLNFNLCTKIQRAFTNISQFAIQSYGNFSYSRVTKLRTIKRVKTIKMILTFSSTPHASIFTAIYHLLHAGPYAKNMIE